ncbi:MAG: cytochrome c-type biosis protein CcmH [Solirubrobacteraceae bacterium]|nr:cytochrome c-type biosis protein CcmH [Solirubrobacteraceae bacterium]
MRRRLLCTAALAICALASLIAGAAAPAMAAAVAKPRTSLPQVERQVMCVTCKIPLNVAQSPQADRERAFIQSMIDRGQSEAQVKQSLVGQYGASVLGLPANHGFNAAAYLVPLAAVLALAATLLVLLPRWRRRGRAEDSAPPAPDLSPGDAARLESDLARFD